MYWNQAEAPGVVQVPDDIVDLVFELDCRRLPVDHAYSLAAALLGVCPWMAAEPGLAIHTVHVAGSQNGWERPAHGTGNHLQVARRTKLRIRAPRARVAELLVALPGTRLHVADCPLTLGPGKVKPLSTETTLFARHVVAAGRAQEDESVFLQTNAATLAALGIEVRKALCGRSAALATPQGMIPTRALMLADLSTAESIRLQQRGLGPHPLMGCGIFIPHKGIDAVTVGGAERNRGSRAR